MFDQYSYFTFKYYQLLALVAVKIGSGNFTFAGVGGYFGVVSVGSQIVRLVVMTRRLEGSELRRIGKLFALGLVFLVEVFVKVLLRLDPLERAQRRLRPPRLLLMVTVVTPRLLELPAARSRAVVAAVHGNGALLWRHRPGNELLVDPRGHPPHHPRLLHVRGNPRAHAAVARVVVV